MPFRHLRVGDGIEALHSAEKGAAVVAPACVDFAAQGCYSEPASLVKHWHLVVDSKKSIVYSNMISTSERGHD